MDNYTTFSAHQEPEMAGFGLRLKAIILDSIFIVLIFIFLAFIFSLFFRSNPDMLNSEASVPLIIGGVLFYIIGLPVLTILYLSLFESSIMQATPGKMIAQIVVTDYRGERASFLRCLVRNISRIISASIFMFGYLMVLFTDKQQTLHDIIAGTYVVKK